MKKNSENKARGGIVTAYTPELDEANSQEIERLQE